MQYSFVKSCLLALAAATSVLAASSDPTPGFNPISVPTSGQVVNAGSIFKIKWDVSKPTGPVTIILMQGASEGTLELADPIAKGLPSATGEFAWAVPNDLGTFKTYGLKLQLDSNPDTFQYSFPFVIKAIAGGNTKTVEISQISTMSSTSTTSAASTSATSTSSAESSTEVITSSAPAKTSTAGYANSTTLLTSTVGAPSSTVNTKVGTPASSTSAAALATNTSGAMSLAITQNSVFGALIFTIAALVF